MVFHWSLTDSKSPQASRTRFRILAVIIIIIIIIIIMFTPWEFFSSVLPDGLLLESEWH